MELSVDNSAAVRNIAAVALLVISQPGTPYAKTL